MAEEKLYTLTMSPLPGTKEPPKISELVKDFMMYAPMFGVEARFGAWNDGARMAQISLLSGGEKNKGFVSLLHTLSRDRKVVLHLSESREIDGRIHAPSSLSRPRAKSSAFLHIAPFAA